MIFSFLILLKLKLTSGIISEVFFFMEIKLIVVFTKELQMIYNIDNRGLVITDPNRNVIFHDDFREILLNYKPMKERLSKHDLKCISKEIESILKEENDEYEIL